MTSDDKKRLEEIREHLDFIKRTPRQTSLERHVEFLLAQLDLVIIEREQAKDMAEALQAKLEQAHAALRELAKGECQDTCSRALSCEYDCDCYRLIARKASGDE